MAGNLTPSQSYDNVLNVISGYDGMHDLQYYAAPASGETFVRGSVCYLDSSGNLAAGGDDTAMPMWAITGVNDFDANGDTGNISGGVVSCYVATGGYEIFTTEYVTTDTYNPNTLLTVATGADAGKVKAAAASNWNDAVVCGCVSKGTQTDVYNQSVLHFWPIFIPKVDIT
jgi:hypothetical protein